MPKKQPITWRFYGCKCGYYKASPKMMGKCPRCGAKLTKYGEHTAK